MISIEIPIADSAAATVNINKENICPNESSKYIEKIKKFKLALKSTISIHIKTIRTHYLLKRIPKTPTKNNTKFTQIWVKSIFLFL